MEFVCEMSAAWPGGYPGRWWLFQWQATDEGSRRGCFWTGLRAIFWVMQKPPHYLMFFFSNDALSFCYFIGAPSYPKWKSVLSSGMVKTLKYLWQKEYIYIYIYRERERDFNSVLYLLPWVQNYSSISKDHDYHKRIKVWIQEIF